MPLKKSVFVSLWILLAVSVENKSFAWEAKLGKLGLAYPVCRISSKTKTIYNHDNCSGFHLDYVEYNTNIVLAYDRVDLTFHDTCLKHYHLQNLLIGYRFDFGDWIQYFWGKEGHFLAPMHFTLYWSEPSPGLLTFYQNKTKDEEVLTTKDFQMKNRVTNTLNLELGWTVNQSWDVFLYYFWASRGPFFLRKPQGLQKEELDLKVFFFGAHYIF